jgi:hypothetical protein
VQISIESMDSLDLNPWLRLLGFRSEHCLSGSGISEIHFPFG